MHKNTARTVHHSDFAIVSGSS